MRWRECLVLAVRVGYFPEWFTRVPIPAASSIYLLMRKMADTCTQALQSTVFAKSPKQICTEIESKQVGQISGKQFWSIQTVINTSKRSILSNFFENNASQPCSSIAESTLLSILRSTSKRPSRLCKVSVLSCFDVLIFQNGMEQINTRL